MKHPPILVTGSHRSGTTWVGKMLVAAGQHTYVSEPLNAHHRPGVLAAPVTHWYTYICTENEAAYLPAFQDTLALRYGLGRELRSLRSLKDVGRMGRDAFHFRRGRLAGQAALLKDPFAAFATPWFADRLGCRVVVAVRHPAAFASSLKRLEWTFNFNDLLEQPLLLRDWLEPYRDEMQAARTSRDNLARACLLWRMIYSVLHTVCQQHPEFIAVRHEDLSRDPLGGFRALYETLGLPFTLAAEQRVLASSRAENPGEVSTRNIYNVNLDSRANLRNWQKRLSLEEIARVRALTAEVANHWYKPEDWE